MSPLKKSNNIAARMGRWSANHWKTAVFGWLAFVVASLFIGNVVGTNQIDNSDANVGQARKADQILKRAGFADQNVQAEFVLVQSKTLSADAPAFRAVVNDVVRTVGSHSTIEKLQSPYDAGRTDQISKDRHTVQVSWQMKGDEKVAQKNVDALTAGTAEAALEAAAATSGRSVLISGFTVMIAMAGMLFSGQKSYLSFGVATMMVVGIAMLGSLTVLPALLSKLGDRVERGRIPFLQRRRSGN